MKQTISEIITFRNLVINFKKMKYIKIQLSLLLGLFIVGLSPVSAQQDPMYTQYMFNTLSVNPAYAGSRGVLNATGLLRTQWVGVDGAPTTETLSLHSPLPLSMGVGLSLVHDKIGPQKTTMLFADYSYTIKVNNTGRLALGLKVGFNAMRAGLTDLTLTSAMSDESYNEDLKSPLKFNFGLGAYYYTDRWYVGLSTPKIVENKLTTGNVQPLKEQRHYFLIAGMVVDINEYIKFKPTILAKYTGGSPVGFDVSANFLFFDKLWLGLAHRWKESISGIVRFQITDQLCAGYSYDLPVSRIRKYNGGSHEIMLSYDLIFNKKKVVSPRYF